MKLFVLLISFIFMLLPTTSYAGNLKEEGSEKCSTWLDAHYNSHRRIELIDEYVLNKNYYLKGNCDIGGDAESPIIVGIECQYFPERDHVVGLPDTVAFTPRVPKSESVRSMKEYRVLYGCSACPTVEPWENFGRELQSKNYKAELSSECIWIQQGDFVYGPPKKGDADDIWKYVQVRLRGGELVWIEDGNLTDLF